MQASPCFGSLVTRQLVGAQRGIGYVGRLERFQIPRTRSDRCILTAFDRFRQIMSAPGIPQNLLPWFEARRKYRLTDAQVQMARELGLNPKNLGGLANHRQEPWKAPLPQFIEECYVKRFKVDRPAQVFSLEDVVSHQNSKKRQKREAKQIKINNTSLKQDDNESQ